MKKGLNWQILLVALVIVVLPALSLMVNFKGAQQGRTFYKDLKDSLGVLPSFSLTGWNSEAISTEGVKGNVIVSAYIDDNNRELVLNTLRSVCKTPQFREEIDNLKYITFDITKDSTFVKNYINDFNENDRKLWHILRGGQDAIASLKLNQQTPIALIDTAGTIRQYYNASNENDKRKLVEHIAVMPIRKKEEKVVKKEQKQM